MDSLSRKRKLSEYEINTEYSTDQDIFQSKLNTERNERKKSIKVQKLHSTPSVVVESEEESLSNSSLKKSSEKLEPIPEICEEEIKPEEDGTSCTEISQIDNEKRKYIDLNSDIYEKAIPWFCTDYLEDIIDYEIYKESLYVLSESFCRQYDINPAGRELLVDWLINVQVYLKAENSALHLAVTLLDLVLDNVQIPLDELQATAISAFWVAYKYFHGSLSMKKLLSLCMGLVTKEMIQEGEILVLLSSRVIQAGGSLTVFHNYILYNIFGVKFPPELYYCGLYLIEIMILQFNFVEYKAYEKATTAVFTSLCLFGCPKKMELFDVSRFMTKRKLRVLHHRLMRSLRLMYSDKKVLRESSVYRKYRSSRYCKISVHEKLKCLATS